MVFSSVTFAGVFLPLTLLAYYLLKNRVYRNSVLLIASLFFYAWGEPVYVLAMIGVTLIDYVFGLILSGTEDQAKQKWLLGLCVILNLTPLFVFKYYNFFAEEAGAAFGFTPHLLSASMPIGISFFTFQSLSYVIDIYRKNAKPQKNYARVLLYVSMFPQLIAGPIVRYSDIENQLTSRRENVKDFTEGMCRFAVGFAKKVILANYAGQVASYLLEDLFSTLSVAGAWIGLITASMQIYFDFAGYSDMAIGLGMMLGFRFKENFRYPYVSRSITEFWSRWHISMGNWFRDYVMYPIALSAPFAAFTAHIRKRFGAAAGNFIPSSAATLVTFALVGLWHGAGWNYVLWGLYFAVFLIIDKILKMKRLKADKIPVLSNLVTLTIVIIGFALFYFTDLEQIGQFYTLLFGLSGAEIGLTLRETSQINEIFWLYPVLLLATRPWAADLSRRALGDGKAFVMLRTLWSVFLIALSYLLLLGQTYNPFIYFRF